MKEVLGKTSTVKFDTVGVRLRGRGDARTSGTPRSLAHAPAPPSRLGAMMAMDSSSSTKAHTEHLVVVDFLNIAILSLLYL